MAEPYDEWRAYSFDEYAAFRKLRRQERTRKVLGGLLLVGAVLGGADGVARDAALLGGAATLKSGFSKGAEKKIHREALKELAQSFDSEVAPILLEVEGQSVRLEGSAETQYVEWRRLLRRLVEEETGLPPEELAPLDTTATRRN
jgi:hypothetical protein